MTFKEASAQALRECGVSDEGIRFREAYADRETLGLMGSLAKVDEVLEPGTERRVIDSIKLIFQMLHNMTPEQQDELKREMISQLSTNQPN